ncbi:DUF2436 domain-containing protein [Prevotella falsenii]|uniref:DUF2436 domain-containing protein n=1 Tax=Prevotella falsenii TaxID=515414 RepID=UPI000469FB14|nr:DUF2436 domain-containing protein [Prevotella falsenii]
MKKPLLTFFNAAIAALFVAMLALPTTACAQDKAKVILEAHNPWQDGSGFQLLLDADHNLYGSKIPINGPLWNDENPPADLYDDFEFKIPENADPVLDTKNILVDGEMALDIPAGIYDYCVAAPQKGYKIWIVGKKLDPSAGDDYHFEAGKTYRFSIEIVGTSVEDAVRITVTETSAGIDTLIDRTAKTDHRIYNLNGTRLSGKLQDLPKGIYIVNGKKVVL